MGGSVDVVEWTLMSMLMWKVIKALILAVWLAGMTSSTRDELGSPFVVLTAKVWAPEAWHIA